MRVAGPSLSRPDPDRSAHLDAVTALGVAASSRAAVGRRDLLTAWAVVMVVMYIRVRRVNRVVRGNLHWGTPWSADRDRHISTVLRGSDIDDGYAATTQGLRLVVIRTDEFTTRGKKILRTLADIEVVRRLIEAAS
jgi:hypothetical protein